MNELEKTAPEIEQETVYRILKDPQIRENYLWYTDDLIARTQKDSIDTIVFLDKSARPVAWFFNAFYDTLVQENEDGTKPKKPNIKFTNIDREQWGPLIGRSEDEEGIVYDRLPQKSIENLQNVFAPVSNDQSLSSGKNVLIVDEFRASGDTLDMASEIFARAFPGTKIFSSYWVPSTKAIDIRSGQSIAKGAPVWYSDTKNTGRGIAGRDFTKSRMSPSKRQRIGYEWLSTRFRNEDQLTNETNQWIVDQEGLKLREEIYQMVKDLHKRKILYRPSSIWSTQIQEERVLRYNGFDINRLRDIIQDRKPQSFLRK